MRKPARSKSATAKQRNALTACRLLQYRIGAAMNEQYLWDKTTEPDDETKELESLLSEFRFQPRPLVLPVAPSKKVFIFDYRIAAIAATVLISFGFLFWLSSRNNSKSQVVTAPQPLPSLAATQPIVPENKFVEVTPKASDQPQRILIKRKPTILKPIQISHKRNQPSMATQERMAKDKLMFALQLTSDKLDIIQHKISADSN